MKHFNLFMAWLTVSLSATAAFGQQHSYVQIGNSTKPQTEIKLLSSSTSETVINFVLNAYELKPVLINNSTAYIVNAPDAARILKAGAPDLPCFATSVIIPDYDAMTVEIVKSHFIEINGIDVAPSKGNLLRTVNPSDVPYTFGTEYQQNAFYPSETVFLREPYILRDYRGVAVVIQPFAYNPITKVLRIYTDFILKVKSTGSVGVNTFVRIKTLKSIDQEYDNLYRSHFLNYQKTLKYTPIDELPGRMLIISDASFMTAMQPLVDWKILKGLPCEMVSVATIGNTVTAIKNYVTNYYNTNGLTFLLLVGDFAQVTSPVTSSNGAKDNEYAYISGSDHYPEFLVGRFSTETIADVQTQVQRSIFYEKTPLTGNWYSKNTGIGSEFGPGDDNEYDYEHIRNLQTKLLGFTYTSSDELFGLSQGGLDAPGEPTTAMVASCINPGTGIVLYCGHGADDAWGTSGFSNTDVAALTNVNLLPFIYSVACVVGHFNAGTCFCEAWMRAKQTGGPTGAIGIFGSTINQSWSPPMEAQDEMVDILVETYSGNIKRTYAGIGENGCMKMNDTYADFDMTDTWTIFGDPSLMVRTKDPMSMTVSHQPTAIVGSGTFQVYCNVEGAYVAITANNQIYGTGYISSGSVIVTLNPALSTVGQIVNVCVTAFNYVPYIGTFEVVNNNIPVDAQLAGIIQPNGIYNCSGISIQPAVIIKNLGTDALTSATVNYQIDGGIIVSQPWTGNLLTFASDTVLFPSITLASGSHTIRSFITNPNGGTDGYPANDELITNYTANTVSITSDFTADITSSCQVPLSVQFTNTSTNATSYSWDFGDGTTSTALNPLHTFNSPGLYTVTLVAHAGICGDFTQIKTDYIQVGATPPVVTDDYVCYGNNATLNASGAGVLNWYTSPSGGTPIQTGTSMNVNNVTSDTTYYVESSVVSASQYVGNTESNINGSFYISPYEHYLIFDCLTPVTLISVEVNAQTTGNRTIQLRDAGDNVLQTATVNIPAGISRITLNFNVPVGANLRLVGPVSPYLYRNSAGCTYPYSISGVISITSSSAGTGYYYYFYDWEVKQPDCVSGLIPVTAHLSQPLFNVSTTDVSGPGMNDGSATLNITSGNAPFTYLWSNGATTQTITGLSEGTYYITVTDAFGCQSTASFNILLTNINLVSDIKNILIFPGPARDNLNIVSDKYSISQITIYDLPGNIVIEKRPNEKSTIINVSGLPGGVYTIEIKMNGQSIKRKITVTK